MRLWTIEATKLNFSVNSRKKRFQVDWEIFNSPKRSQVFAVNGCIFILVVP